MPHHIDWIDAQYQQLVDTLMAWSAVNSWSYNPEGLIEQAALIEDYVKPLGANASSIELPPEEVLNAQGKMKEKPLGNLLCFEKRPEAKKRVLLVGHYDTVFSHKRSFLNPVRVNDDKVNGPGVSDMKGGLLIMFTALQAFEQLACAQNIGWTILINPDEEIGSPGSKSHLVAAAKTHHIGLDFEPSTDRYGTLAGARKGSANYHIVVQGRSAHAGRAFDEGRNAIAHAAGLVQDLHKLNQKRDSITVNVAACDGSGPMNVVPKHAVVRFNVRFSNNQDVVWFEKKLDALMEKYHLPPDYLLKPHVSSYREPKPCKGKTLRLFESFATVGDSIGQKITWKDTGGVCDGNDLAAQGLPTIDTLGAIGGGIHSSREWIKLSSLTQRAKLTTTWLEQFATVGAI